VQLLAAMSGAHSLKVELDELTLRHAQRGDSAAFRRLVHTYERAVFALLSRMLAPRGRRQRVEDLAQETFLRVFRALPAWSSSGPARLSTWILTIATRLALDELSRAEPVERGLSLEHARALVAPERADQNAERRATAEAIARAVATLEPGFQAVFLLRELHELEYDEIARALETDLGTVKSRLHRARAALREALAAQGVAK
jgi:RNA polymerase sigma-70 factor (ECF subfamily)